MAFSLWGNQPSWWEVTPCFPLWKPQRPEMCPPWPLGGGPGLGHSGDAGKHGDCRDCPPSPSGQAAMSAHRGHWDFLYFVFMHATVFPYNLIYYHSSNGVTKYLLMTVIMHFSKALFSWCLSFIICYSSNANWHLPFVLTMIVNTKIYNIKFPAIKECLGVLRDSWVLISRILELDLISNPRSTSLSKFCNFFKS